MEKSPLVEVLGSFTSNAVTGNSLLKYQVMRYGISMCIDMGIKFSVNFGCKNLTGKISCNFIGTAIGMPMYSEIFFLKILVCQNLVAQRIPGKMLDQYYQNNCSQ